MKLPAPMCGILQVFSRRQAVDRARFEKALALIKHRGPDHTGTHYHEQGLDAGGGERVWVASGHQRLSILDLCERSHQPFRRDGHCLVFNGEVYNFRDLAPGLEAKGSQFTTSGDTEVLFEGLRHEGLDFLKRCNGMWGFTFLDEVGAKALVSRDRHGKKPVFYYADDDQIIISSMVSPIYALLGRPPRIRDEMIDAYLADGVMFPPQGGDSHFEDLRQVPPGHSLEIDLKSWSLNNKAYFDVADEPARRVPEPEELPVILRDAVVSRLVADRKVGLLLSGGIDSTLVLSVIHSEGLQDQVRCYIGDTGRSKDAEYARQCVEQLGIDATDVRLGYGNDAFDRYLRVCHHQEKPFPFLGSSLAMSEMYERIALDDVRVVLDGTGGDEQFGGYWDRLYPAALRQAFLSGEFGWLWSSLRQAPKPIKRIKQAARSRLWHCAWRRFRQRVSPAGIALGFNQAKPGLADPLAIPLSNMTDAMVRDAGPGGRLGEWIWHNDRNAMMAGIENRSPILDYRLLEFMGTGYDKKFVNGWNKHELRKVFDAFTPLPTQWRREKQGFRWSGREFLRQNRDSILDMIRSSDYLGSRYNTARYVDLASNNSRVLTGPLTPRLLSIAGVEAAIGLAV